MSMANSGGIVACLKPLLAESLLRAKLLHKIGRRLPESHPSEHMPAPPFQADVTTRRRTLF